MSPDSKLIQRLLTGDPFAGCQFIDRFGKLFYSTLVRLCGIPEDHLDDAFEFVCMKLYEDDCRRLRAWHGESALTTYLFAVTRNLGRDYMAKKFGRARLMAEDLDDVDCFRDHNAPTPEDEMLVRRMEGEIRKLVDTLEEICRKIIDMKFDRDMSYKEVALAAGITVSNVGVRLHRCLEALTQLMKRNFPDLFEDRFNLDM